MSNVPPSQVLPPVTSSQNGAGQAAQLLCRTLSTDAKPRTAARVTEDDDVLADFAVGKRPETKPKAQPEVKLPEGATTLRELAKALGASKTTHARSTLEESDADEFDAGTYLKKHVPQVRKFGAALAGAAIQKKKP